MESKDTFFSKTLSPDQALVMGILNITPDSFYASSRAEQPEQILSRTRKMIEEGVDILDIGAYSSRPGAKDITVEEELNRLLPSIRLIRKEFPGLRISVDTFRASVAEPLISEFGIDMINDISGGEIDQDMFPLMARLKIPYILMHMKGTPANMQKMAVYGNLIEELRTYFTEKIRSLREFGLEDIILDPGFGFAKTADQNFEILSRLEFLGEFGLPVLVGLSRKSMVYRTLETKPEFSLNGSSILHTIALMKGARILRTHDVREAREAVILYRKTFEDAR